MPQHTFPPIEIPEFKSNITDEEFRLLRELIHSRFGINLTEQKRGLLVTRLNKYMKQHGLTSFQNYYEFVRDDRTGQELGQLANLISTNHTFFFRESEHFDFLRATALPQITSQLNSRRDNDLRIWCAAASTGEEPYGIMITLKEFLGTSYSSWKAGLLATDISENALSVARTGVYNADSVERIPAALRDRYFKKQPDGNWEVKPILRNEITYRRFNLMNARFPFKRPFHIIFCRNVMIYFDQPTVQDLVGRFYEWTVPGGYLFVGHSESLGRIKNPYNYVKPAVYQRR